jgi:hypothetical protein
MSETSVLVRQRVLWLASVTEIGTGIFLIAVPATVVELLLGTRLSPDGMPLARVAGIALLALGLACWHTSEAVAAKAAFRGMLVYNTLLSAYFLWLGVHHRRGGLLLWPAVAFHAVVALLLLWTWTQQTRTRATNP